VDAALRLGLRDTLDAVRAALVLEDRVRAAALHGEHDLLEAAALALVRGEQLRLEPAALRVAREHAEHVAGPDRGLVAADALADLDDHVLVVCRVLLDERELQLLLELGEAGLRLGNELLQLGVGERRHDVLAHRAPLLRELERRLELLQPPAHGGRLVAVVVDGGVGHPLLNLGVRALEVVDQGLDRRSHAA
jgi:hypothetical protein